MKLHLDLSRQEMETNPNKIAPCGVIVIVEIIRRDCLMPHHNVFISVCLPTNQTHPNKETN